MKVDFNGAPPRLAKWLIGRLSNPKRTDTLLGDLDELYQEQAHRLGRRKAAIRYWKGFFSLAFHGMLWNRNSSASAGFTLNMMQNYLRAGFRNIVRQKVHSLITIAGLSIGICFSLLIFLFVINELSYDQFHTKKNSIVLLAMTWHFNGTTISTGANCSAGGPFMKESFPEVADAVRISPSSLTIKKEGLVIKEPAVYFADSSFFKIFTFPFIVGNPDRSLTEPNSIVVTESMAKKYFGDDWQEAGFSGGTIETTNNKTYKITGVIKDPPVNSHLQFSCIVSFASLPVAHRIPQWDNSEFYTYLLLEPEVDQKELQKKIPQQIERKFGKESASTVELDLVPLNDVYLHNEIYKLPNTSDIRYVRIFIAIAVLILVIATFNYINLATARSMERALEVGVRKVMGAFRAQLFTQFMGESLIIAGISLVLALGLVKILIPFFNPLTGKTLNLENLMAPSNLITIILLCVLISLLAGIYPALILSNYKVVKVLKGKLKDSVGGIRLRKILVISQFTISIALIICTLTISRQLNFMRSNNSGFDRDQIVALSLDSLARTKLDQLKNRLSVQPSIVSAAASMQLPVNFGASSAVNLPGEEEKDRRLLTVIGVDSDFPETAGLTVVSGPGFTKNIDLGANKEVLLNESALPFFGWTSENAVGKEIIIWQTKGIVKGVVKDFYSSSLHNRIKPLLLFCTGKQNVFTNYLLVKFRLEKKSEALAQLGVAWKTVNPESPFITSYLSDQYELLYRSDAQLGWIINLFAILALLISALGLFGLASYSILQRTKELGIRKILGASVVLLMRLVSVDFIRLVTIGFIIAVPVSFYLMNLWLSGFNYKVSFSWTTALVAGLAAIVASVLTIAFHTFQAARNNPVEALRNE